MLENNKLSKKIYELKGTDSFRVMSEKTHGSVSHSYFNTLINGDTRTKQAINPTPEKLQAIAKAYPFKTSYSELMSLAGYEPTNINNLTESKPQDLKDALENDIMLAFDGKPISDKYKRIILELLSEED